MNWKIKVTIGEVSMEAEIPLSERSVIDLKEDGTAGKTMDLIKDLTAEALKTSLEFENTKPKIFTAANFRHKGKI
jgi:hypothetical protein